MTTETILDHGLKTSVLDSSYKTEQDQNWAALDPNRIASGTFANRPAAGTVNRFYYATDTQVLYWDNGATWDTTPIILDEDDMVSDSATAAASQQSIKAYAAKETLGTWTPVLVGATTTTYTSQIARYTRIGRMVFAHFLFTVNSLGDGSATQMEGLPFNAADTGLPQAGSIYFFDTLAVATYWLGCAVNPNEKTVNFTGQAALDSSADTLAIFGNSAQIRGVLIYETDE